MTEKRLDEARLRFLKEGRIANPSPPAPRQNNSPYAQ